MTPLDIADIGRAHAEVTGDKFLRDSHGYTPLTNAASDCIKIQI